jgi:hypothetical protein
MYNDTAGYGDESGGGTPVSRASITSSSCRDFIIFTIASRIGPGESARRPRGSRGGMDEIRDGTMPYRTTEEA